MPRPIALHVLQETPTDPAEAGPENRLCVKCGRWDGQTNRADGVWVNTPPSDTMDVRGEGELESKTSQRQISVLFLGTLDAQDKEFLLKITRKAGYNDSQISMVPSVLCGAAAPDPDHLRMCRAFILGIIRAANPGAVVAVGPAGLASLRGKSDLKKVDSLLGRELEVKELQEVGGGQAVHI